MIRVGWCSGNVSSVLSVIPIDVDLVHHRELKAEVHYALSANGWTLRRGRGFDFIASRGNEVVAIACDRKTPRKRKLNQLQHFNCTGSVALLRD